MTIRTVDVLIDGLPHTVQVNDEDSRSPLPAQIVERAEAQTVAEPVEVKARTPRDKSKTPATNKAADAPADTDW